MSQAHTAAYEALPFEEPQPPRHVPRWAWALAVFALAAGVVLAVAAIEYDEVIREWLSQDWLSLAGASEAGSGRYLKTAS